ncbi:hypothetical protein RISK_001043 [Rhodopirellula islandica]|uniref:Uncharacterized protein n=1 Tax=Rhodopirellula islandica TaxID=595434 RepID=A0A0J1BL59_RHOIS|nr:hypothetical protein RISK_001043 [Rhodopirellula islandica]
MSADRTTAERWQLSASGFQPEVSGVTPSLNKPRSGHWWRTMRWASIEKVKL